MTGLLVWLIPWPLLNPSLLAPPAAIADTLGGSLVEQLANTGSQPAAAAVSATADDWTTPSVGKWVLWVAALLPGLLLIIADMVRHRRTLAQWHRNSTSGEHLRTLLPPALMDVPLAVRVVPRSRVAAATGLFRGTIWIGDALVTHAQLRPALLHECLHIARRDPALILILRIIRRLYFWNPLVGYFVGRAGLFVESACDEGCARILGRRDYRDSLATLILDSQREGATVSAMVKTGKHDVLRVKALSSNPRVRPQAWIGAVLGAVGLGVAATLNAQNQVDPRIGAWDELRTSSNFQSLRRVFEKLDNGMTRLVVNAKLLESNRWHVDFRCDGRQYPIVTQDNRSVGITYSCRQTGVRTFETTSTHEQADPGVALWGTAQDWTTGTGTETVSADGESYTTAGTSHLTNGQTRAGWRNYVRRHQ